MSTITLRLEEDVLQKIDSLKGDENRSEYIRSLIVFAIEYKKNTIEHKENTELIQVLRSDIEHLRSQNVDLTKLLNQEQSLHLQTQRQLMPGPEEIIKKNWWQFWKK
jgi:metal-responsive CopG/Arc/MetJ family transcriptional regulator